MNQSRPLTTQIITAIGLWILASVPATVFAQCSAQFSIGGSVATDTVCINQLLNYEDLSTSDGSIVQWVWLMDGQVVFQNQVYSSAFLEEGIYTMKLAIQDDTGCQDTASHTVVALGNPSAVPTATDISCHGLCDGSVDVIFDSQNAAAYTITWAGTPLTGQLLDQCAGSYSPVVIDDFGCTTLGILNSVQVMEPAELLATVTNGPIVYGCDAGSNIPLDLQVTGGTPGQTAPYTFSWSPASDFSDPNAEDPALIPTINGMFQTYSVTVIDGNGCETTTEVQLLPSESTIEGDITVGGVQCASCRVSFLIPQAGQWERYLEVETDGGHYVLNSVPGLTDFKLMADPDDAVYSEALQTYYAGTEGTHLWEAAVQINSGCGTVLQKNIDAINPPFRNGNCTLRGHVYGQINGKTTTEDPIPLIDVVVEKTPPGNPQGKATTDLNGEFEFNLMEASDTVYRLVVNIPGLPMTSTYVIQIDPNDALYNDLDLCVSPDTTFIAKCSDIAGIDVPEEEESLLAYPNPSQGTFTLKTGSFSGTDLTVMIFDASGRSVWGRKLENASAQIPISGLASGYYTLRAVSDNRTESLSLSVIGH